MVDNPTMKQAIKDVKMEVCGSCLSVNCALKQMISKSMQMKKLETVFGCKGNPKRKFMDLVPKEVKTVDSATPPPANDPPVSPPDQSAEPDTMARLCDWIEAEDDEAAGNQASSQSAGFKILRPPITQACLPTPLEVKNGGGPENRFCVIWISKL